jgi:hypothetical protein
MNFTAWPEIEGFHNVRKYMRLQPDTLRLSALLHGNVSVAYKAKVKLHGTNAAVRCFDGTKVVAQSRTKDITPSDDNAGFAQWVATNEEQFRRLSDKNIVVYGEWCGKGIQKGVAISQVDRLFAVFAARLLGTDQLIIEPEELQALVSGIPGVHVLPWLGAPNDLQFFAHWDMGDEVLQSLVANVNYVVAEVERIDPWVKENFGVEGTGEGIVCYPVSKEHLGFENFTLLCFKAKGEKHKNVATAKPAQLNAEAAASVDAFAELVVTEARLIQGAQMVQLRDSSDLYDMKRVGAFIQWILADVEKETQDELEASGLTFKQVSKAVSDRARKWYIEKSRM